MRTQHRFLARLTGLALCLSALSPLALPEAHAQVANKTPMQQASPIVDTLAARMNKLVRDIEAAGADMPKVRGLADKSKADNERLEQQLAAIKAAMSDAEKQELDVYMQLKFGKAPDKLKAALDKAQKEAAEAAAKVGPATVARYREQIAKLADEGDALVRQVRDAAQDSPKRDAAWKALAAWDQRRHELMHQVQRDPNVLEPQPLVAEADAATQPQAVHATRLYRLLTHPLCPELQKELAKATERAKPILELESQFTKPVNATARRMALAQLAEAKASALEVPAYLTQDEADELRDAVLEKVAPILRKVPGSAEK